MGSKTKPWVDTIRAVYQQREGLGLGNAFGLFYRECGGKCAQAAEITWRCSISKESGSLGRYPLEIVPDVITELVAEIKQLRSEGEKWNNNSTKAMAAGR